MHLRPKDFPEKGWWGHEEGGDQREAVWEHVDIGRGDLRMREFLFWQPGAAGNNTDLRSEDAGE